jgi:hypothetical protein
MEDLLSPVRQAEVCLSLRFEDARDGFWVGHIVCECVCELYTPQYHHQKCTAHCNSNHMQLKLSKWDWGNLTLWAGSHFVTTSAFPIALIEDSSLQRCDTISRGKLFRSFWRYHVTFIFKVSNFMKQTLKM